MTFDLFLEENNVRFSGISLIDKENNTSDCMLRTQPYQNTLIDHLPARVLKLTAYSFDDADLISLPDSLAQQSPFLRVLMVSLLPKHSMGILQLLQPIM